MRTAADARREGRSLEITRGFTLPQVWRPLEASSDRLNEVGTVQLLISRCTLLQPVTSVSMTRAMLKTWASSGENHQLGAVALLNNFDLVAVTSGTRDGDWTELER